MPKKKKRKPKSKKTIPLNVKSLNKAKLPTCVSKGYLISQKNGVTRIFTDYIKNKDKPTFETIGNTTLIPTAVIESIKKIN